MEHLNHKNTYSEIKQWYEDFGTLPETLDGEVAYYRDLPYTVKMCFYLINSEIEKFGIANVKFSEIAMVNKTKLIALSRDLIHEERHNIPLRYQQVNMHHVQCCED